MGQRRRGLVKQLRTGAGRHRRALRSGPAVGGRQAGRQKSGAASWGRRGRGTDESQGRHSLISGPRRRRRQAGREKEGEAEAAVRYADGNKTKRNDRHVARRRVRQSVRGCRLSALSPPRLGCETTTTLEEKRSSSFPGSAISYGSTASPGTHQTMHLLLLLLLPLTHNKELLDRPTPPSLPPPLPPPGGSCCCQDGPPPFLRKAPRTTTTRRPRPLALSACCTYYCCSLCCCCCILLACLPASHPAASPQPLLLLHPCPLR